jgi:hypothetical protein
MNALSLGVAEDGIETHEMWVKFFVNLSETII